MNIAGMKQKIQEVTPKLNMVGVQGLGNMQVLLETAQCLEFLYNELSRAEQEQLPVKKKEAK